MAEIVIQIISEIVAQTPMDKFNRGLASIACGPLLLGNEGGKLVVVVPSLCKLWVAFRGIRIANPFSKASSLAFGAFKAGGGYSSYISLACLGRLANKRPQRVDKLQTARLRRLETTQKGHCPESVQKRGRGKKVPIGADSPKDVLRTANIYQRTSSMEKERSG